MLPIDQLYNLYQKGENLQLSPEQWARVEACHAFLLRHLAETQGTFYGINTGFGSLCEVRIEPQALTELQHNLLRSHACGLGNQVPIALSRWMLLLKIQNLALGHSGIAPSTLQRLIDFYNLGALPVVYELGSLGASGDLAPLAHLSLPLIGEGQLWYEGRIWEAAELLPRLGLAPLELGPKEGLALLNGTQFSLAYGLWALFEAERLNAWADALAALSLQAYAGLHSPFDARLHQIRPHAGQVYTAAKVREWLSGSTIKPAEGIVQDPYAFRCVPQVHGASRDALSYARSVLETEAGSVTDNPNIFPDTEAILSGGNFHAQPLALVLDFMAIALAELGSISERRLYQLIGGKRGLPPFLSAHSGLHSGLMITQYTAASIASQNKQFCTPASVDSIISCNGQEDHVSMAANAGTKLRQVVLNVERLLAIELFAAAQALSFRQEQASPSCQKLLAAYREQVPLLEQDRFLAPDLQASIAFIQGGYPETYAQ